MVEPDAAGQESPRTLPLMFALRPDLYQFFDHMEKKHGEGFLDEVAHMIGDAYRRRHRRLLAEGDQLLEAARRKQLEPGNQGSYGSW